jgi:hypothetical protein
MNDEVDKINDKEDVSLVSAGTYEELLGAARRILGRHERRGTSPHRVVLQITVYKEATGVMLPPAQVEEEV